LEHHWILWLVFFRDVAGSVFQGESMDFGLMLLVLAEGSIVPLSTCMGQKGGANGFKSKFSRHYGQNNSRMERILASRLRALKSTSEGSKSASDAGSGSNGRAAVAIMSMHSVLQDALHSCVEKKKRKSLFKSGRRLCERSRDASAHV
jgi:hypothetical protein